MRGLPHRDPETITTPLCIHAAMHTVDLLHIKSLLALRLLLRDPHLLEKDIGAIVHGTGVAFIRALLAAERRKL